MICSDCKLQAEHRKKFLILLINGYPNHIMEKIIACELKDFISPTSHMVKKALSSSSVLVGNSFGQT